MSSKGLDALVLRLKIHADELAARGNGSVNDRLEIDLRNASRELARLQPARVPEGWMLVPREPTKSMLDAADRVGDWGQDALSMPYDNGNGGEIWDAMLAAAPAPDHSEQALDMVAAPTPGDSLHGGDAHADARCAALQAERDAAWAEYHKSQEAAIRLKCEADMAILERDALAADARRYRWLRDLPIGNEYEYIGNMPGDTWDELIDAGMEDDS